MLKEEIQAQINILNGFAYRNLCVDVEEVDKAIAELRQRLPFIKSIQDIEREAFEAGRSSQYIMYDYDFDYETFEDYLKSKNYE